MTKIVDRNENAVREAGMVCVRKCQVLMMAMTMMMMFNLVRLMRMLMTAMIMMTMKDIDLSKKIKPPDFQANNFTP